MQDSIPPSHQFDAWIKLSLEQRQLYSSFVTRKMHTGMVNQGWKCCLPAIQTLRQLINHPLLFLKNDPQAAVQSVKAEMHNMTPQAIIAQSPKLQLLVQLLNKWLSEDLKVLVFSHSVQTLDIIQHVLPSLDQVKACRIDGKTTQEARKKSVHEFNSARSRFNVMLLSNETGGTGLTLTGANKSVLFDPHGIKPRQIRQLPEPADLDKQNNVKPSTS